MAGSVNEPAGEWLDDKWVSEGNTTKTGGRAPVALLQGRGGGRCGFPGAQPDLCLCCFTTVPNLGCPKATSVVTSKLSVSTFGGNGTEPLQRGGGTGGPLVTCQKWGGNS